MANIKVNVSELSGKALDYAVAVCEGVKVKSFPDSNSLFHGKGFDKYSPSTNWAIAGPIIEREEITIDFRDSDIEVRKWNDELSDFTTFRGSKKQVLILVFRCYVASKMGKSVEIPQELL